LVIEKDLDDVALLFRQKCAYSTSNYGILTTDPPTKDVNSEHEKPYKKQKFRHEAFNAYLGLGKLLRCISLVDLTSMPWREQPIVQITPSSVALWSDHGWQLGVRGTLAEKVPPLLGSQVTRVPANNL